ncbi:hypothetical protein ACFXG4_29615 [Nocardia sp. NPDC059246]|uniref:hypothetical protein n=1 Tax=unclassified Nocardia TaxID=2637762 RepID=UPI0036A6B99C
MTSPMWFSQPYPAEGASAAEGIRNQLGKPELDYLTILVRESAQNSWDARTGDTTVDFRMDLRTISAADTAAWRQHFLNSAPPDSQLPLRKSLNKPIVRVLSISDRGTRGLGGPTRADKIINIADQDFASFLRNIGEPRHKELGGGTYGFGKGILYLVSKPGVILVHTRCKFNGSYETRLMGAALWRSYQGATADGIGRYTGRHWWGDGSGAVIEPLTGEAADTMARRLGLQPFGPSETGTTITVVDPDLGDREPPEAAGYLAETIAWQLWPKMLATNSGRPGPAMKFTVTCDGIEYPVPDPSGRHPLRLFVAAYQQMIGTSTRPIQAFRPKRLLGRLGLVRRTIPPFYPSEAAAAAGINGQFHHVCLMRPAELVVTYWPGPKPPSELISYAGVFRADTSMDKIYAAAEPPTHDAWNYQSLEDRDNRTFVKTTFTRLKEAAESVLAINRGDVSAVAGVSLGAASDRFSPLIGGVWGTGSATDYGKPGETRLPGTPGDGNHGPDEEAASTDASAGNGPRLGPGSKGANRPSEGGSGDSSSGPKAPRRPRIDYIGTPYLDEYDGMAVVVQEFRLPSPLPQHISAELAVALTADGGRETEPPAGAAQPDLIGWQDQDGLLRRAQTFTVTGGDGRVWKAIVKPAPDTMTDIKIRVSAGDA